MQILKTLARALYKYLQCTSRASDAKCQLVINPTSPFQRTFSLLSHGSVRLEEFSPAQPEPEQVLREDRETSDEWKPEERVPLGHESCQDRENGRGSGKMVQKRPHGH